MIPVDDLLAAPVRVGHHEFVFSLVEKYAMENDAFAVWGKRNGAGDI